MSIRPFRVAIPLLAFLFHGCRADPGKNRADSTRDTLVRAYFKRIATLPYYDTSNLNFQLLKAYTNNDTSTLKALADYTGRTSTTPWMNEYLKPCALNLEFDTLTAEEAYRFSYESSFCDYYTIATIVQRGGRIRADATVYKNASKSDSLPCTIVQHGETELDRASWSKFQEEMLVADFWGSAQDNEYSGNDGNSLDVQGYRKFFRGNRGVQPRRHYVSRWSWTMDHLLPPFLLLLRRCKISKGCIR